MCDKVFECARLLHASNFFLFKFFSSLTGLNANFLSFLFSWWSMVSVTFLTFLNGEWVVEWSNRTFFGNLERKAIMQLCQGFQWQLCLLSKMILERTSLIFLLCTAEKRMLRYVRCPEILKMLFSPFLLSFFIGSVFLMFLISVPNVIPDTQSHASPCYPKREN